MIVFSQYCLNIKRHVTMKYGFQIQIVLILFLANFTFCANILFLNGVPSPSHHIFNRALVIGLVERGHNLTYLSADKENEILENLHFIHLEKTYETFYGSTNDDGTMILGFANESMIHYVTEFSETCLKVCRGVLASHGLEQLLQYPSDFKFDAVIYDYTFGPCLLPVLKNFNSPPLISISAFTNPPSTLNLIGGHQYPAYIPHYVTSYHTTMGFIQRIFNTFLYILDIL